MDINGQCSGGASSEKLPITRPVVIAALKAAALAASEYYAAHGAGRRPLTSEHLLESSRGKKISFARHIAMLVIRRKTNGSLPQIGKFLGGRDHTTILHGIKKLEERLRQGDKMTSEVLEAAERHFAASQQTLAA